MRLLATASALVALASLAGCSTVRSIWPFGHGHGDDPSACAPSPVRPAPEGPPACAPAPAAPEPTGPPPPSELGPVVAPPPIDAPPPPAAGATPPLVTLPAMPQGPRPPWSMDDDADLPLLPADVGVATARPWTVVVLHHSATGRGSAALFDKMHRERGWEGVGYDFVIGNGTDTPDGAIEVTFRWREQKDGAHAKGWNDVAIGICLVGNYEQTDPTPAQTASLVRLLRHLRRRFGIPAERVVGHARLNPTACPGKRFPMAAILAASTP